MDARARTYLHGLLARRAAGELTAKDRLAIPAQPMATRDPMTRARGMDEVARGFTETRARLEALRCLQCPGRPCDRSCPAGVDIRSFVDAVARGELAAAMAILRRDSLLPGVCGRVCPQETLCQAACAVGKRHGDPEKAVAIGRLERFVADRFPDGGFLPEIGSPTGKRVAVVGAGPGGLTAAAELRRAGHAVTVFEALHRPGGVLIYGIPAFRLPKSVVDREVAELRRTGVRIVCNFVIGRSRTIAELMGEDGYDAVFVGAGAGLPVFMGVAGENLAGVYSANEYLTRANLMKAHEFGAGADTPLLVSKRVAVIGGGNVAMDAARMALRLGATKVYLVYRRGEAEIPARAEEIRHAREEGVEFRMLRTPTRVLGDGNGRVVGIECRRNELGTEDAQGRRRPLPVAGSESILEVDTVVVAIGNRANELVTRTTPGMEVDGRGNVVVDWRFRTSLPGVFAGGDIVSGAATVVAAIGHGRVAAAEIDAYLAEARQPSLTGAPA
jgi:glutamate synthase (NADPH) small chain